MIYNTYINIYSFSFVNSRNMKMAYKFPKLINETHYNNRSIIDDLALFVFIPNDSDIDQSINNFVKLRSEKRTYNDEVWLLDVSSWPSIYHAMKGQIIYFIDGRSV